MAPFESLDRRQKPAGILNESERTAKHRISHARSLPESFVTGVIKSQRPIQLLLLRQTLPPTIDRHSEVLLSEMEQ
jgi:hypothetical protein